MAPAGCCARLAAHPTAPPSVQPCPGRLPPLTGRRVPQVLLQVVGLPQDAAQQRLQRQQVALRHQPLRLGQQLLRPAGKAGAAGSRSGPAAAAGPGSRQQRPRALRPSRQLPRHALRAQSFTEQAGSMAGKHPWPAVAGSRRTRTQQRPCTLICCSPASFPALPEQGHQVEEERLGGLGQLQLLGGHQGKGTQPGGRHQTQNQPPLRRRERQADRVGRWNTPD